MKLIHKKKHAQNRHARKYNPKKLHLCVSYPKPNKEAKKSHVRKVKFKSKK